MTVSRRTLLISTLAVAAAPQVSAARSIAGDDAPVSVRAVAFDGLALFDPRPVFTEMTRSFGAQGPAFVQAFRSRQFEYAWLRTLSDSFVDFEAVTDDALRFAHRATGVELPDPVRLRLLAAFHSLEPWPDVAPTLAALAQRGVERAVLSNFTTGMLRQLAARASLDGLAILSVDAARAYKPDARAYGLATQHFARPARDIAFVAFASWDAAGARHFGFRTYWANRLNAPTELLGATAERTATGLDELVDFLGPTPRARRGA